MAAYTPCGQLHEYSRGSPGNVASRAGTASRSSDPSRTTTWPGGVSCAASDASEAASPAGSLRTTVTTVSSTPPGRSMPPPRARDVRRAVRDYRATSQGGARVTEVFVGLVTHPRSRFNADGAATAQARALTSALTATGRPAELLVSDRDDFRAEDFPLSRADLARSAAYEADLEYRWRRYLADGGGRPARSRLADEAVRVAMTAKRVARRRSRSRGPAPQHRPVPPAGDGRGRRRGGGVDARAGGRRPGGGRGGVRGLARGGDRLGGRHARAVREPVRVAAARPARRRRAPVRAGAGRLAGRARGGAAAGHEHGVRQPVPHVVPDGGGRRHPGPRAGAGRTDRLARQRADHADVARRRRLDAHSCAWTRPGLFLQGSMHAAS